jgi:hypothetical protein
MENQIMNIFESEYEYDAFMLNVAYDYETRCYRKISNRFYVILSDEQLLQAAKAYKKYLSTSNLNKYKKEIKEIFKKSPEVSLSDGFWEILYKQIKEYKTYQIAIMSILAIISILSGLFLSEVIIEKFVLILCSLFLGVKPLTLLVFKIMKK